MKLTEVRGGEQHKFKPIVLEITLETLEEARLLYHVLNHTNLKELIMKDKSYGLIQNIPIANNLCDLPWAAIVKGCVKDRGYNI